MLESIKYKGLTISINIDDFVENPREINDNLGTMICFHKRYDLGDKHNYCHSDYQSWDEVKRAILKDNGASLIFPIYMYDHSGLAFSLETFNGRLPQGHAEFDSGRVGFMFVTKKKIRKEFGKAGKSEIEKVKKILEKELEIYEKYANGECYYFNITDEDDEIIDSCTGYYNSEDALEDAKSMVAYLEEEEKLRPTRQREQMEANGQLYLEFN